jgi:hypothetical protein
LVAVAMSVKLLATGYKPAFLPTIMFSPALGPIQPLSPSSSSIKVTGAWRWVRKFPYVLTAWASVAVAQHTAVLYNRLIVVMFWGPGYTPLIGCLLF